MATFQTKHMMQLSIPHRKDDAEWRRIHDDKPTLESFTATWNFWATKKGRPGLLSSNPWNRRYWLVAEQFLVYFDNDKPSCKAGGALYLNNCRIAKGKPEPGHDNIVVFQPMVPRRPGMAIDDESNEWLISFDSPAEALKAIEVCLPPHPPSLSSPSSLTPPQPPSAASPTADSHRCLRAPVRPPPRRPGRRHPQGRRLMPRGGPSRARPRPRWSGSPCCSVRWREGVFGAASAAAKRVPP